MSEHDILSARNERDLVSNESLADDLRSLGLECGMTVLVHSSLSSLGWVLGGAQAVITALENVLGDSGTLMMPAHSTQLTEPRYWRNPPVPESWWPRIRATAPVFDQHLTPTRSMGTIAELFRNQPAVLRSDHPHGSFAGKGPRAQALLSEHVLEDMWGEGSPLARLYEADGHVLLLGVDHGNNSSLHLAENRADLTTKVWQEQGARLLRDGIPQWVSFRDLDGQAHDFAELGEDFCRDTDQELRGAVGWGEARLMRQRAVVDYGKQWLEQHRSN